MLRRPSVEDFVRLNINLGRSRSLAVIDVKPSSSKRSEVTAVTRFHPGISPRRRMEAVLKVAMRVLEDGKESPYGKQLEDEEEWKEDEETLKASLAELILRLILTSELKSATSIYSQMLYWQDQLKHPFTAWLESGPFTWFSKEPDELTIVDKIDRLEQLLAQKTYTAGLIQQHLTRKVVNTDLSYLSLWTGEALEVANDIITECLTVDRLEKLWNPTPRHRNSYSEYTLRECVNRAMNLQEQLELRYRSFRNTTRKLRPPSLLRRRWLHILVASPFVLVGIRLLYQYRSRIPTLWAKFQESSKEFFYEHVNEPARAIAKELLFNEHDSITDPAALQDAKQSLERMLEDFLRDAYPEMPDEERRRVSKAMDMSTISTKYEKSLPQAVKHVLTGDIVRMLLIQVQFIKKELLVAMSAIDDLMDANEFNFRLMAIFPAVIVIYTGYQAAKSIMYTLQRKKGRRETAALLRSFLLSMERMLNLRNVGASEEDIKSHKLENLEKSILVLSEDEDNHNASASRGFPTTILNPVVFLKTKDLGLLLLFISQFSHVLSRSQRAFTDMELRNLVEDVHELSGNCGPVTVTQQLCIVQRMFRSYRFLQNQPYSIFSSLGA